MGRSIAAVLVACVVGVTSAAGSGAETPRRGGTVVIGVGNEPACLNRWVREICAPLGFTIDLFVWQVLEGAFEIGPDLTYRPNLVSHVTVIKKPFTLTYHIRPEARWSDGTPVTASDFVFTFQTILDPKLDFPFRRVYEAIRRVRAVDAKTFRVVFRSRFAGWRDLFLGILPRHALAGEDFRSVWRDTIDNPKTGRPIGSGPFLVERWVRGRELTLVRNPRYWGPHQAYLDRVVFRFLPGDNAAQIAALRSGQVDVIYPQIAEPSELAPLRREPGISVASAAALRWEHLSLRLRPKGHPALANKLVRRALAYGIDREALVRLFRAIDPSLRPLDNVVFMTNSPAYRPNWGVYRYRPAEARRLLEQAGCRRGEDGVYACGGERLSLRFVTTAGNPVRELTLQLVQAQLKAVGVEVVPVYAPPRVFFTILPEGDFDAALFSWIPGPDPGSVVVDMSRCGGAVNYTGYCSRQVTRDVDQSNLILDADLRAALLNRIDARISRDVPMIPLYQRPTFLAYRATLRNVVENPSFDYFTWNSEDWWLER